MYFPVSDWIHLPLAWNFSLIRLLPLMGSSSGLVSSKNIDFPLIPTRSWSSIL
jgi:hypothetical protein